MCRSWDGGGGIFSWQAGLFWVVSCNRDSGHVYVCICAHTHTHTRTHTHAHARTYTHTYAHAHADTHTRTHTHTYNTIIHTYIHTIIHTYIHAYLFSLAPSLTHSLSPLYPPPSLKCIKTKTSTQLNGTMEKRKTHSSLQTTLPSILIYMNHQHHHHHHHHHLRLLFFVGRLREIERDAFSCIMQKLFYQQKMQGRWEEGGWRGRNRGRSSYLCWKWLQWRR